MTIKNYACYNKDILIRKKSSSGGIFYLIAETVIKSNGIVFGVKFNDEWEVVHDYAQCIEDVIPFLGSKYSQSKMGNMYKNALDFLKNGRLVLFSGTPCQIAGLKSYIGLDYKNLITVDFICHGVPSPKAWDEYLKSKFDKTQIKNIYFRDKSYGWEHYCLKIEATDNVYCEKNYLDLYMQSFLKDVNLRPSCYSCQFKGFDRKSDITLADMWGARKLCPKMYDGKGTSIVMCHSEKGKKIVSTISQKTEILQIDKKIISESNKNIMKSPKRPHRRKKFFRNIGENIEYALKIANRDSVYRMIKNIIKGILVLNE